MFCCSSLDGVGVELSCQLGELLIVELHKVVSDRSQVVVDASLSKGSGSSLLELRKILLHVVELLFCELCHVGSDLAEHLRLFLCSNLGKDLLLGALAKVLSHLVGDASVVVVAKLGQVVTNHGEVLVEGGRLSEHVASLGRRANLSHVCLKGLNILIAQRGKVGSDLGKDLLMLLISTLLREFVLRFIHIHLRF